MVPSSALATAVPADTASSLPHLSLVKSSPSLDRDNIEGLAMALLDLGSGYESALRSVMSVQRLLERVRHGDDVTPESALLLQEMARQIDGLADAATATSGRLEAAAGRLRVIKGDGTP
jgi:hypothetical protein